MTGLLGLLEDFGDGASRAGGVRRRADDALARARGEGHAAGYAEGYAAAVAAIAAEDRSAVAAVREAIEDMRIELAGARAEAIESLRPVAAALARAVAPRAAAAGLADALADAVERRLASRPGDGLTIRAPAARVAALAERFGDLVEVRADPALEGARVRLDWEGGGADYDAEGCAAAAIAAVDRFFADGPQGRKCDVG